MNKIHSGVVEDIDDPLRADRVRVRVFGLHSDDKTLIPTQDLPWAQILKASTSASISGIGNSAHGLVCGSWVKVIFEDPDEQYPLVIGSISGVSTSPNDKASYEEVAFGVAVEQTKAQEQVQDPLPQQVTECGANVNIQGFKSKFSATNVNLVLNECCNNGIKNPYAKIAVLSIVAKECGFVPKNEKFNYSVSRLREVFPTKTAAYTDYQLRDIVGDEESLANFLYGGRYSNSKDEGFKYRGRGFIQVTFKANYELAAKDTGEDLLTSPDLLNVPGISAKASVKYIIRRAGGLGLLNSFTTQADANRSIAQSVIGRGVNLNSGYGLEYFKDVTNYSKLGFSNVNDNEQAEPIGKPSESGEPSDGLTPRTREMLSNSNVGFKDPSGKYPLLDMMNEPDTNRLARRNTDTSVFNTKKKYRRTGIQNVGGSFDQPVPPYNSSYPYNRGYFSESGHALEFDDTESQERISLFHKSGTFSEIDVYGNRTNKIIGNDYTIIEKNGYLFIDGTLRMTVASSANISIQGNVNLVIDGSYNVDVGGDINMKAGGKIAMHAGGDFHTRADGNLAFDGTRVDGNYDVSSRLSPSARDPVDKDYPQVLGESVETSEMISIDDMDYDEAEQYIESAINSGKISKEEVDADAKKGATEKDTTIPEKTVSPLPGNCAVFSERTNIPPETSISRYFKLSDLTTRVALPSERNKVTAHKGLSEAQIVCNLKKLAENSLDPIKERYSDMIITNAFRKNNNKSQHNIGQAADLQFTTARKSDYFEIAKWIKDNVLFDQLLLEYRSNGRPWIHISYSDTPRKIVLTLMNHKTHSQGLSQLG